MKGLETGQPEFESKAELDGFVDKMIDRTPGRTDSRPIARREFLSVPLRFAVIAGLAKYYGQGTGVEARGVAADLEADDQWRLRRLRGNAAGVTGRTLITADDIEYEGLYTFPITVNNMGVLGSMSTIGRSPMSLTYREDTGTFLVLQGDTNGSDTPNVCRLYELTLPAQAPGLDPGTAPKMVMVKRWGAPMSGMTPTGSWKAMGIQWLAEQGGVLCTFQSLYQVNNDLALVFAESLSSANDDIARYGSWRSNTGSKVFAGSFTKVTQAFADACLGGDRYAAMSHAFGGAGHSHGVSLARTSFGSFLPRTTPPNSGGFTTPIGTDYAITAEWKLYHDTLHQQRTGRLYRRCGPVGAPPDPVTGNSPDPYTCAYGANLTDDIVPIWGTGNTSLGTNDTMTGFVEIDLPDKRGLLYFSQLVHTPEGYVAPFDANGISHRGYSALTNEFDGQLHCCHGQLGPSGAASPGPWAHTNCDYFEIYDDEAIVSAVQSFNAGNAAALYTFLNGPRERVDIRTKMPAWPLSGDDSGGGFGHGSYFHKASRRIFVIMRQFERQTSFGTTGTDPLRAAMLVFRIRGG